jgi:hypothetical protein
MHIDERPFFSSILPLVAFVGKVREIQIVILQNASRYGIVHAALQVLLSVDIIER